MEINIYDAKTNFSKLINSLLEEKEDVIIISKNGKPVVQMTLINKKNSKRLGSAKKEMNGFDMSLEDFNSIEVTDFEEYLWNYY